MNQDVLKQPLILGDDASEENSAAWRSYLPAAFAIGGLREIGEPARKALIVDLSDAAARGRTVGLYYAIRGFSVAGAGFAVGALLGLLVAFWLVRPLMRQVSDNQVALYLEECDPTLEAALQDSESRYRALFENSIDAILVTGADGWLGVIEDRWI